MTAVASTGLRLLRVDQVGSLLRPAEVKEAFVRFGEGRATEVDLRQAEDDAIRAVVGQQEGLGLPVVTDGEFRRLNFQDSFGASVGGFETVANPVQFHFRRARGVKEPRRWDLNHNQQGPAVVTRRPAIERIRLVHNRPLEEYRFARSVATRPVKVTLIGPDRITQRFAYEESRSVYRDVDEFLADVVAIERQMIGELGEAGCHYVQIDAPGFTAYVDGPSLAQMRARSEDPDASLERSIEAENAVIAGFPDITFGIHLCRGNQRSMWHREGSYDAIAERLFARLDHHRLLLEYDTERAGGFEPLRFVPKRTLVVLGLISTKVSRLETVDELLRRIEAADRFIPVEQLALSPQCGFASDIAGNLLSEDDQWRKLEVMLETSAQVWGSTAL